MPPKGSEAKTIHQETVMFKKSKLPFTSLLLAASVWAAPASAYHWNAKVKGNLDFLNILF